MTRIGLAIAGIGMTAALTACGGSDFTEQSGQEIADASKEAMKELDAVKVAGSITTEGQEVSLDIQTDADGDCTGTIGVQGGTAELLGVGGDLWFRPDEAFWQATGGEGADQIIELVGDKWVVAPTGDDGFGEFCDVDSLLDQLLENDSEDDATFTKGDTEDVDGDDAIAIERESEEDGTSTGYVLVDDPHYLVKIEKQDGDDTGSVTFSEFDEEFDVEAPGEGEAIDLDDLAT